MSDLIDRQALCEYALNQKDKSITPNEIMRFPSVEPQWISVSKKLPKYSDTVLVSLFDGELDFGSYFCKRWHVGGLTLIEEDIVLAWMPLPEPYEGDKA